MPGVIAYHVVLTAYGFWLPNDPRGSWSDFVRSFEIYRAAGRATKTNARQSVANRSHDQTARQAAKTALKYPPVRFTGTQARAIAHGFADYADANDQRVYALSVMPDHVHVVIARGGKPIERVAEQFKARATMFLNQAGLHPMPERSDRRPSPWARNCWKVYLNTPTDIRRAIKYVEQNPIKAGFKPQRYTWVVPFPGT